MIIKQEVSYYVQMEYENGVWKSIGAMDMGWDYILESWNQKKETFPRNHFRLIKKTIRHEVDEVPYIPSTDL